MNEKTETCNAADFSQATKVQIEIGKRLFERLHYLKIKPRYVLDLGCGPGVFSRLLKKHYPHAQIVGLDFVFERLQDAKSNQGWWRKWPLVNADITALPFPDGLFDLVFANQVIHRAQPLSGVVSELSRVISPDGCLMFSTLGPDTFCEVRKVSQDIDLNPFPDMHDVGDRLLADYFLDPVVDMDMLTAHYATLPKLLDALKTQGVPPIHSTHAFEQAMSLGCTIDGKFPLTYEVVYGHAWKGAQRRTNKGVETSISVAALKATIQR